VGKNICYQENECRHQQYQSQIKSNQVKYQTEIKKIKKTQFKQAFPVPSLFIPFSLLLFLNPFCHAVSLHPLFFASDVVAMGGLPVG